MLAGLAIDWTSWVAPFRAYIDRLARPFEPLERLSRAVLAEGSLLGDWARVTSVELSDSERVAAMERLADRWFPNPIHPRRMRLVMPELRRRASIDGTAVRQQLRNATIQAIALAFAEVPEDVPMSEFLRVTRARLSRLVTEDLAGPGWRQCEGAAWPGESANGEQEIRDSRDVEFATEVAHLSTMIARLLSNLPHGQRGALLARIEGRPLSNAQHQALFRLRKSSAWTELLRAAS